MLFRSAEVPNEEIDAYCVALEHFIQKDRGISISDAPIGCDFDIGDDYSMGKFETQYMDDVPHLFLGPEYDSYIQNPG